jgi:N-methylhydantoinase A
MAYGKGGTEPTVTDAALILGYVDSLGFLDGAMRLDPELSRSGMQAHVAQPLHTDVTSAAAGIFDVLIANTVGAIREITVERGKDPRDFSLLAFGGAGPMIAPMIAREVGAVEVIVPNVPAAFSAWGMLMSDLVFEVSRTDIRPLEESALAELEVTFGALETQAVRLLADQGVVSADRSVTRLLECRYVGQEHAIAVNVEKGATATEIALRFNEAHMQRFGHALTFDVQASTLRVRATGHMEKPPLERLAAAPAGIVPKPLAARDAFCFASRAYRPFSVHARRGLLAGQQISGPALIDEGSTTTVVHSDQHVTVDPFGNLLIRHKAT